MATSRRSLDRPWTTSRIRSNRFTTGKANLARLSSRNHRSRRPCARGGRLTNRNLTRLVFLSPIRSRRRSSGSHHSRSLCTRGSRLTSNNITRPVSLSTTRSSSHSVLCQVSQRETTIAHSQSRPITNGSHHLCNLQIRPKSRFSRYGMTIVCRHPKPLPSDSHHLCSPQIRVKTKVSKSDMITACHRTKDRHLCNLRVRVRI